MKERNQHGQTAAEDDILAPFLAAARGALDDDMPVGLRARLVDDALARMPGAQPTALGRGAASGSLLSRWLDGLGAGLGRMLGGAPGVAVLTAAGVTGLWIGMAMPVQGPDLLAPFWPGASAAAADDWADTVPEIADDEAILALLDSF
ncbi:MAG: hypothetical protein HLUCCA12_03585 [Rhodobacteraceae bacterium HLUCCA12]|nr:MAG: hypothetical protein HLUCCA12_03585 [Rhodobacteraceae bacterium HLUCCA12]